MLIYENIKELADKKKIPLRKIEQKAGLSNGVISKWKTASPNVKSLQAVAKVLNVPVNTLLKE